MKIPKEHLEKLKKAKEDYENGYDFTTIASKRLDELLSKETKYDAIKSKKTQSGKLAAKLYLEKQIEKFEKLGNSYDKTLDQIHKELEILNGMNTTAHALALLKKEVDKYDYVKNFNDYFLKQHKYKLEEINKQLKTYTDNDEES